MSALPVRDAAFGERHISPDCRDLKFLAARELPAKIVDRLLGRAAAGLLNQAGSRVTFRA